MKPMKYQVAIIFLVASMKCIHGIRLCERPLESRMSVLSELSACMYPRFPRHFAAVLKMASSVPLVVVVGNVGAGLSTLPHSHLQGLSCT